MIPTATYPTYDVSPGPRWSRPTPTTPRPTSAGRGIFRLNIGLSKAGFGELFPIESEHDLTALDIVMPHPVYAPQHFVCVLNPEASWPTVLGLLEQAHEFAARRHANAAARRGG